MIPYERTMIIGIARVSEIEVRDDDVLSGEM
jgi:hypothetical protein